MRTIDEVLNEAMENPKDTMTWGEWKDALKDDIAVMDDDSAYNDSAILSADQAREAFKKCTVKMKVHPDPIPVEPGDDQVNQWLEKFQNLLNTPPEPGYVLRTINGSPLKIDIECRPGNPVFMSTRAFVPNEVCGLLRWVGPTERDFGSVGWKVILLPAARDEAMRRLPLADRVGFVKSIRIVRMAGTGRSLLGEIHEW